MMLTGFEHAEVLKVREERQSYLSPYIGNLQFAQDDAQVLHRAGSQEASPAHECGGFVVPLIIEEVDRILQRPGGCPVVLRGAEDEAVEGSDLLRPFLRMILRIF